MKELDYIEIGSRIRKSREENLLTQENLAEMLNVSVKFVRDIETGAKGMSLKTLNNLSKTLMLSTDYILYGGDEAVDYGEIIHLMRMCPASKQRYAFDILKGFIRSHIDDVER